MSNVDWSLIVDTHLDASKHPQSITYSVLIHATHIAINILAGGCVLMEPILIGIILRVF